MTDNHVRSERSLGTSERAAEVFASMPARVPELTRTVMELMTDTVPEIAALNADELARMERSVGKAMQQICAHLGGAEMTVDHAYAAGRQRAEAGVPFAAIFKLVVESTRVMRDAAAALIPDDEPGLHDVLSTRMFDAVGVGTRNLLEGYQQAAIEQAQRDHHRRGALVESLLAGRGRDPAEHSSVAESLGLPVRGTFRVLVASTPPGQDSVTFEVRHRPNDPVRSVWRVSKDEQIAVLSLPGPDRQPIQAVVDSLPDACVGVSIEYTDIAGTPEALRRARLALACLVGTIHRVAYYGDDALATLLLAAPAEAGQLVRARLGPVLDLPAAERDVLLETMRVWFDCAGSTPRAAEVLHCHRNTARHRLLRIGELTASDVSDPASSGELLTALRAIELFPGLRVPYSSASQP
ncbi:PucR family transcriptional regulator [Nocardia sp. NPDC050175]|uniref:PucR family transcriptional regulator n=1 Tax=Nocardia sp. NPDC050175 TaxID=3364317 RepID=UPI0037AB9112